MKLSDRIEKLKKDLTAEGGPQISAMKNFQFAILQYFPEEEFEMRRLISELADELRQDGRQVKNISLLDLLLKRLSESDDEPVTDSINRAF